MMLAAERDAFVEGAAEVLLKTIRTDIQEQLKRVLSRCLNDRNAEFRLEGNLYVLGATGLEASDRVLLV